MDAGARIIMWSCEPGRNRDEKMWVMHYNVDEGETVRNVVQVQPGPGYGRWHTRYNVELL